MISKPLKIDGLKKIFVGAFRKLDKKEYAKSCMDQLKSYAPVFKDAGLSEKAKADGNKLYGRKDLSFAQLYEILVLFNESIALAPKNSKELATAYANKSAVLMRMRKYQECITEIDKALKITESNTLKTKLLCRKAECLTALGSADSTRCLEKAKFIMTKLEGSAKEKLMLDKLINKTQSILEKRKLDIPKEDKRRLQALEMIGEVEEEEVWESARMEYSEKFGRHLVAARDFDPGETILVDKPYLNNLDDCRAHQYCDHCFYHLWTVVPCDHCCRRLYCSEDCKTQAWNEHHEIDCFALPHMKIALESKWDDHMPFFISLFCKAVREAGSIEQLIADSEASNQYEDQDKGGITSSKDFSKYKNIFTLPVVDIEKSYLESCTEDSISALVGLAKYTQILGRSYDFKEIKKLMDDEKAILVGALLLKLKIILGVACPTVYLVDPKDGADPERQFNLLLSLLVMHTLSGCMTNVESIYTYGNRHVLCAIRPIKAGDQLILHSKSEPLWPRTTKSQRQLFHKRMYSFPCKCIACTENWSDFLMSSKKLTKQLVDEMHCQSTKKLWEENNDIVLAWRANRHKASFPDISILLQAAYLAKASWKGLSMPSAIIVRSVLLLIKVSRAFYDPSEIYAKMPELRLKEIETILNPSDFCFYEKEKIVTEAE